jgi:glycosyltransferase involved in cell wall biosynthesis
MKGRVRILHLRMSNFVGGPERQLLQYGDYERDGPLELIFGTVVGQREGRDFAKSAVERGLRLRNLAAGNMGDIGVLSRLVHYVREQGIALICTHSYKADILGTLAGLRLGTPVAWFLRGWTGEDWKVRSYERLDRTFLPLATRVVCLSPTQARQIVALRRSLARKISVVHNAVETRSISAAQRLQARRTLRMRLALPDESPVVATAGRLSPEKGTACFLQAIPMIANQFPEARFVIFGAGPLKAHLEEAAQSLRLGTTVRFMGFAPDFADLLPGIDVIVNPSLSEVMPNTVLESMAAAVPVVATSVGGLAEIAGPDGAVALIPVQDSQAIARAVIGLLYHPERAAELGSAGKQRVEEAFSRWSQKAELRTLYGELVPGLAQGIAALEQLAAPARVS